MGNKNILYSAICLAISIIISSIIIASILKGPLESIANCIAAHRSSTVITSSNENNNMCLEQAAYYLNVSPEKLEQMIKDDGLGIPYLKVSGDYIFNKGAIDEWLKHARVTIQ